MYKRKSPTVRFQKMSYIIGLMNISVILLVGEYESGVA